MREISAPGTNVLGRHGCRPRYLPALLSFVRCRVGSTVVLGYDRMNHCVFDGGWTWGSRFSRATLAVTGAGIRWRVFSTTVRRCGLAR